MATLDSADRGLLEVGAVDRPLRGRRGGRVRGRRRHVDSDPGRLTIAERLDARPVDWRPDGSGFKLAYQVMANTDLILLT